MDHHHPAYEVQLPNADAHFMQVAKDGKDVTATKCEKYQVCFTLSVVFESCPRMVLVQTAPRRILSA